MSPVYFLLLAAVFAVNLLQGVTDEENNAALADDIPLKDIEFLSDVWPWFVNLKQPFQVPDSDNVIEPNFKGTLMRVEGDSAVVDFGRDGTHRIYVKKTNLIPEIRKLLDDDDRNKSGLFKRRMFNKFFKLKDEKFVQSDKKDIRFDYFLLLYADLKTEKSETVVSWFLKNKKALYKLSCSPLLMPMDSTEKELLDDMRELNWVYPSVYHWTCKGHREALAYDPTPNPSIVLIDGSGRMLSRGSDVDFLDSIADLIEKDKTEMNKIRKKYKLDKQ